MVILLSTLLLLVVVVVVLRVPAGGGGGGAGGYRTSMPEGPGGPLPTAESQYNDKDHLSIFSNYWCRWSWWYTIWIWGNGVLHLLVHHNFSTGGGGGGGSVSPYGGVNGGSGGWNWRFLLVVVPRD
jgi:hypothetical protein